MRLGNHQSGKVAALRRPRARTNSAPAITSAASNNWTRDLRPFARDLFRYVLEGRPGGGNCVGGPSLGFLIGQDPKKTGFQFVPSLIARQGTLPVPPVLRYTKAPTFLAAVRPAAVSEATFVKPRIFRFSCSPLRIFSKLLGTSFPIIFLSWQVRRGGRPSFGLPTAPIPHH